MTLLRDLLWQERYPLSFSTSYKLYLFVYFSSTLCTLS